MAGILLLYYSPVVPFSPITPSTCICMPKNNISWIDCIISIHLKYIIQTTIQPALFTIKFSYALENTSIICYNTICTCVSTSVRSSYSRMAYISSFSGPPMRTMWK